MRVWIRKLLFILGFLQLAFAVFLWYSATRQDSIYSLKFTPSKHVVWPAKIVLNTNNVTNLKISQNKINQNMTSKLAVKIVQPLKYETKNSTRSKCGDVTIPLRLGTANTWHPVDDELKSIYVFSAYYSDATKKLTLIGIRMEKVNVQIIGQLWYYSNDKSESTMEETNCDAVSMSEGHGRRFTASTFECSVTSGKQPTYVSMVTKSCRVPLNLFPVHSTTSTSGYKRKFTVCLLPLNYKYSRAFELVEWIELNRLTGADVFTIYNYSSATNIGHVLEHYSKQGVVEVVQWSIPVVVDTWPKKTTPEIHYFGQLAMLQDCLYRNKRDSQYVVNLDLDEFIIPRGKNVTTWSEMINSLNAENNSFVFRNTFFRKEYPDNKEEFPGKPEAVKYQLVTLLKTSRENEILPHGSRSKYIANTERATRLNVHTVTSSSVRNVQPDVALLHHYRNWLRYNESEKLRTKDAIVVDKYAEKLIEMVNKTWKMLPNVSLDLHTT